MTRSLNLHILLLFILVNCITAFLSLPPVSSLSSPYARHGPAAALRAATQSWDAETDVVVIGSGIGGLSCAALLAYYGVDVQVYESHYHAGGCAHGFEIDGFQFDSGPSLWNGMDW
jgi:hypothetical protein